MPHGIITAIEEQQKHPGKRYNVFVQGRFALSVAAEVAAHLRVGQYLSEMDLARLVAQDEAQRATDAALRFLSYRPRSEWEVRQRLQRKSFGESSIEAAIDKLKRLGLLNDEQFAQFWVDQRQSFRPRGARLIRQELKHKGVSAEVALQALATIGDEDEVAYQAGLRKARSLGQADLQTFRRVLGSYLVRRGFSYESVRNATLRLWREAHEGGLDSPSGQAPAGGESGSLATGAPECERSAGD